MTLRLPPRGLAIPPAWTEQSDADWQRLREDAAAARRRAGAGAALHSAAEALRPLLLAGNTDAVHARLTSRTHARALAWLWCETDGDCRDTISVSFLAAITAAHPTPSILLTHQLETAYLERFDDLDDLAGESSDAPTIRQSLAGLLRTAWSQTGARPFLEIEALCADDAPRRVATALHDSGNPVPEEIRRWSLDGHDGGRFLELVRQHVFLDRLRDLPLGADEPVLTEVEDPANHRAPHLRGRLLGHAALTILIDRAETYPGERWRDVVLAIAGDPRRTDLPSHREWWRVLGSERTERVMSWMARADLSAFLDALQHFAEDENEDGMRRMLPPRQRFLEGLVDIGMVRRSRLFLGRDVRSYAARTTPVSRRWDSARLTNPSMSTRALLYLDCGDFHLIEGSHNTKLWVYPQLPSTRITDPLVRQFAYDDLTKGLAHAYRLRHGADAPYLATAHQGLWQHKPLEFLAEHGIAVNAESVLSTADYQTLRARFGLPFVRRVAPEWTDAADGAA